MDGDFNRRDLFELVLRAAALPGAAVFFSAWLPGQQDHHHASSAPPEPAWLRTYQPKFFTAEEFAVLQSFTEILIPTDEDPGAREAYCAHFIDFVLQASAEMPQTQAAWRRAMQAIAATGFYIADSQRRLQLVGEMSKPELEAGLEHPAYFAYRLIKHQTAFAFYTSRTGMIDVLNYKGNSYNAVFPGCHHPEHQVA